MGVVIDPLFGADQVCLDEPLVAALQDDRAGLDEGIPELENGSAPYRVQGTAGCWMRPRPQRIWCPSCRVGPDWSGMVPGACGSDGSEFAALVRRAIETLPAA